MKRPQPNVKKNIVISAEMVERINALQVFTKRSFSSIVRNLIENNISEIEDEVMMTDPRYRTLV